MMFAMDKQTTKFSFVTCSTFPSKSMQALTEAVQGAQSHVGVTLCTINPGSPLPSCPLVHLRRFQPVYKFTSTSSFRFTQRFWSCMFCVYSYSYSRFPSSYVEDPIWQGKFTAIWCACLGAAIIVSVPSLVHALRQGRAFLGFFGVSGGSGKRGYSAVISEEKPTPDPSPSTGRKIATYWDSLASVRQWSVPYLDLNAGQGT